MLSVMSSEQVRAPSTPPAAGKGSVSGWIFDVQRFSIHDGPGIRTTVFMKGCPLRCAWCHNPEGVRAVGELSFIPERCIGCGWCFRVCRQQAHQTVAGAHVLARTKCIVCGACATECHAKALELVGREATVAEVLAEVLRDTPFYETSGGGLTLSGGEPLLQIEFTEALLAQAKAAGLHCCVETCGEADWQRFERIRRLVDLFLFDCKETDPAQHRRFTGVSNKRILENLHRLDAHGAAIILRCPIIPGVNDRDDHFEGIRRLAAGLAHVRGVELMPYHRLGEGKVARFGLDGAARISAATPAPETVAEWKRKLGGCVLPS